MTLVSVAGHPLISVAFGANSRQQPTARSVSDNHDDDVARIWRSEPGLRESHFPGVRQGVPHRGEKPPEFRLRG